ncbi:hypothetical protein BB14905_22998 [Bacillus sp. B14905]|nr:hypothetical protein BB14905_22998 [Bacillus sp. B14905]
MEERLYSPKEIVEQLELSAETLKNTHYFWKRTA